MDETENIDPLRKPPPELNTQITDSSFDAYQDIFDKPVSLSEQEVIDIMNYFPKGGRMIDGKNITATEAVAELVASEFNGRFPGAGTYEQLRRGESQFAPGARLSNENIIEIFSDLEDKGYLQSLGRRFVENVPATMAFGTGYAAGKRIQKTLPNFNQKIGKLPGKLDIPANVLQTVYNVGKFSVPYVMGFGSSILATPYNEPFGELTLGKKKKFTPESYTKMRLGEFTADTLSFTPYLYFSDRAATDFLRDYMTNRLSTSGMGRSFDLSVGANKSLNKQIKEAKSAITKSLGGDKRMQGPIDATTLLERGVESVLQGKVPPRVMRQLLTLENALIRTGTEARTNPPLTAFYEAIATSGGLAGLKMAADQAPGSGIETVAEMAGPVGVGAIRPITLNALLKAGTGLARLGYEGTQGGLPAMRDVFTDYFKEGRDAKAFKFLLDRLEKVGSLDGDNLKKMIKLLEQQRPAGIKATAGSLTKDPAILALEAAIVRDFPDLAAAQKEQLNLEKNALEGIIRNLGFVAEKNIDTTAGADALRLAGQLKESIFKETLNNRLVKAEDELLSSFYQLKKIRKRGTSKLEVEDDGESLTGEAARRTLNNADTIELSDRLMNLVEAQMKFSRGRQQELYAKVGRVDFDRNSFFNDKGERTNRPRFVDYARSVMPEKPENSIMYAKLKKVLFDFAEQRNANGELVGGVSYDLANDGTVSLKALSQQRSELLAIARDGNERKDIRQVAGSMAEAIQDDLNNFVNFGGYGTGISKKQIDALQSANSYSKAFADVFYRSFVGDMMKKTKEGGFRVAPELLHQNFKINNMDPGYLKIKDIMKVGDFVTRYKIEDGVKNIKTVNATLDRILREVRAQTYDPQTKTVNRDALQDWVNNNNKLQEVFPDLFEDLDNFINKSNNKDSVAFNNKLQEAQVKRQTNFMAFLYDSNGQVRTDPTNAIGEALVGGRNQGKNLDDLIASIPKKGERKSTTLYEAVDEKTGFKETFFNEKDAKKFTTTNPYFKLNVKNITVDREKAIDGFKSAMFEYLINGKTQFGAEKKFKYYDMYNTLFEKKMSTTQFNPRTGGEILKKETLSDYLLRKGIFTKSDVKTAEKVLEELIGLEASDPSNLFDDAFSEAKPMLDFAVSIGGSAVGTKSQALMTGEATGPGSIIAASRGAQLARDLFLRMPQITKKLFLADLLQNPQLLAKMLREYGDGKQSKGVFNAVQSYLIKNGYVDAPRRIGVGVLFDDEVSDEDALVDEKITVEEDREVGSPLAEDPEKEIPDLRKQLNQQTISNSSPSSTSQVTPSAPVPTPTPQAQAQPSSGPTDPNTRARYASLFPNDPISGMLNSGGIASLRG
tara:strand:- start:389 stop:4426 length:4038 start_codon:yes stop_codon:yes gene_type:complete